MAKIQVASEGEVNVGQNQLGVAALFEYPLRVISGEYKAAK